MTTPVSESPGAEITDVTYTAFASSPGHRVSTEPGTVPLVLLCAQWPATISRLSLDHVETGEHQVRIRLGREPVVLSEPLATLVRQAVATRQQRPLSLGRVATYSLTSCRGRVAVLRVRRDHAHHPIHPLWTRHVGPPLGQPEQHRRSHLQGPDPIPADP